MQCFSEIILFTQRISKEVRNLGRFSEIILVNFLDHPSSSSVPGKVCTSASLSTFHLWTGDNQEALPIPKSYWQLKDAGRKGVVLFSSVVDGKLPMSQE